MQIFELFATIELNDAGFNAAIDNAADKAGLLYSSITAAADGSALAAKQGLGAASAAVNEFSENIKEASASALEAITNSVASILKSVYPQMHSAGSNMISGLWAGISDSGGWLNKKINSFMAGVVSGVKNFFGIRSPSTLFREEIGAQLTAGMAEGIESASPKAVASAEKMAKSVFDSAKLWIEAYRLESDYLAGEELAMWEYLSHAYDRFQKQKVDADKNAAKLREQIAKDETQSKAAAEQESFEHSRRWIEARKLFGVISLEEEAAAWERVQARFMEGTKQRENADRALYEVRQKLVAQQETLSERIYAAEQKYNSALESRTQAIFGAFRLFDELKQREPIDGRELTSGLREQVSQLRSWSENIVLLSQRGISDGLLSELRKIGPTAAAELRALSEMTDLELSDYCRLWEEKYALARQLAETELSALRAETDAEIRSISSQMEELFSQSGAVSGTNYIQNAIDALRNRSSVLLENVRSIAAEMKNAFGEALTGTRIVTPEFSAVAAAGTVESHEKQNAPIPANVVLNLNGAEIARALISDIRSVNNASPALVPDF